MSARIEVTQKIQEAIFTKLSGNITYDGSTVTVADGRIDNAADNNYIYIGEIVMAEMDDKSSDGNEVTILLHVVSEETSLGAKEPVQQIMGQVMAQLNRRDRLTIQDVTVVKLQLVNQQINEVSNDKSSTQYTGTLTYQLIAYV